MRYVSNPSHNRRLNHSFGGAVRANTSMKVVWGGNRDAAYRPPFVGGWVWNITIHFSIVFGKQGELTRRQPESKV
jgi:hypothetical protein